MSSKRYKVLIADDEYWTREKLRNMITWEKYSMEFMEPAVDGEDVLRKMEEEKPDILITDINMPFLNGTQLLEIIQARYPDVVTFVISGYNDFAYVKDSFMSGAINYLLKPVAKIDLVNALAKALGIISKKENEKIQLLKAASLIQDREFSHMVAQQEYKVIPGASLSNKLDIAGMSMILVKIHDPQELILQYAHDMNLFSYHVKCEIKKIFRDEELLVFNYVYRSNEFLIITELPEKEVLQMAEKLKLYLGDYAHSYLTICLSGRSYSMDSIHMAYVETIGLLMTRKFCRKNEIISKNKNKDSARKVHSRFRGEHEKHIVGYLNQNNRDALKNLIFQEIGLAHCSEADWTYLEVKQTVKQILNAFMDYVVKNNDHQCICDMDNLVELADKTVEYMDEGKLCDVMKTIIEYLVPETREKATDTMKDIVKRSLAYIDEHYFEEISLASLAEHYNVESSYYSRVFKQEVGENLILYLTRRRVEKATEYITDTDLNLTEIAFMVGYDDYTYFSRVFKKNTGLSPRDYRKKMAAVQV